MEAGGLKIIIAMLILITALTIYGLTIIVINNSVDRICHQSSLDKLQDTGTYQMCISR